uniref:Uncharacterized protein n=1 Tax=Arion vulgaris TaxID=1028688 RepID=A0A0B6ZK49_9EUPU
MMKIGIKVISSCREQAGMISVSLNYIHQTIKESVGQKKINIADDDSNISSLCNYFFTAWLRNMDILLEAREEI